MDSFLAVLALFVILFCCWNLVLVVFSSKRRKKAIKHLGLGVVVVLIVAGGGAYFEDQEAKKEGYLDSSDQRRAEEAGFKNSEDWQVEREQFLAELEDKKRAQVEIGTIKQEDGKQKQAELDALQKAEPSQKVADDGAYVSSRFCYAIAAMSNCDAFLVRSDKEEQLEKRVGTKLRFEGSPFEVDCLAGSDRFWDQMSKYGEEAACIAAWDTVGPVGSELSGLLIENSFNN